MWLINCATCASGYFVGTHREIELKMTSENKDKWSRLRQLVLKFATPGATINIFLLGRRINNNQPIAKVSKLLDSKFQLPDCTQEPKNGITLPPKV